MGESAVASKIVGSHRTIQIQDDLVVEKKGRGSFKRALEYELDKFKEDWDQDFARWAEAIGGFRCVQCGDGPVDCLCAAEERCVQCGRDADLCECLGGWEIEFT